MLGARDDLRISRAYSYCCCVAWKGFGKLQVQNLPAAVGRWKDSGPRQRICWWQVLQHGGVGGGGAAAVWSGHTHAHNLCL